MPESFQSYKGYLLDLDGTVYRGNEPIPEAVEFVTTLKKKGIPYLFVTNNSTAVPRDTAAKLERMNVPCKREHILTTSMAAASYILSCQASPTAFVIGEKGLKEAIRNAGIVEEEENPDVVVIGMDRELTYDKLAGACLAVRKGARFISTNADIALPSESGFLPGNGALTSVISVSTGVEPVFIGKPESIMIEKALTVLGTSPDDTILVGDNYDTDILAGIRAGIPTLHVGTGVTPAEELHAKAIPPTHAVSSLADWPLF